MRQLGLVSKGRCHLAGTRHLLLRQSRKTAVVQLAAAASVANHLATWAGAGISYIRPSLCTANRSRGWQHMGQANHVTRAKPATWACQSREPSTLGFWLIAGT